jgi:hypothetical protein
MRFVILSPLFPTGTNRRKKLCSGVRKRLSRKFRARTMRHNKGPGSSWDGVGCCCEEDFARPQICPTDSCSSPMQSNFSGQLIYGDGRHSETLFFAADLLKPFPPRVMLASHAQRMLKRRIADPSSSAFFDLCPFTAGLDLQGSDYSWDWGLWCSALPHYIK